MARVLTVRAYALPLLPFLLDFVWIQSRAGSCIVPNDTTRTTDPPSISSGCIFSLRSPSSTQGIHFWAGLDVVSFLTTTSAGACESILHSRNSALRRFRVDVGARSYIVSRLTTRRARPPTFRHKLTYTIRFMILLFS